MEFLKEYYPVILGAVLFIMDELIERSRLKSNSLTGIIRDIIKLMIPKKRDKIEQPR